MTARSSARSVRERTSSLALHDGADWDADMLAELIIGGSLTSFEIIGTVREAVSEREVHKSVYKPQVEGAVSR